MPHGPRLLPALLAAVLSFASPLYADKPIKKEDPNAGKNHVTRGSAIELQTLEKNKPVAPASTGKVGLPPGAEVRTKLGQGERPALRFLKEGKAAAPVSGFGVLGVAASKAPKKPKFPQHKNRLENPNIRPPKDFEVEYTLTADAEVVVQVLSLEGLAIVSHTFPAGARGAKSGLNKLPIWDGRDMAGREMPPGMYFAQVEIRYAKGAKTEQLRFSIPKK